VSGPDAVGQLSGQLRELIKAVRLLKQQRPSASVASPSVLSAIDAFSTAGGCHVKDLAARCALDPSTVSRAVASVVQRGLVERTADPHDRRAITLALTERGRVALAESQRWSDSVLGDVLAGWSPDELAEFRAMLQRFTDDLLTHVDASQKPGPATAFTDVR
jgi:DNA-binding MarR family transcriptional regulator